MNSEETNSVLERLIEICQTGESLFRAAAEQVEDRAWKSLLRSFAQQRRRFAEELLGQARRSAPRPNRLDRVDPIRRGDSSIIAEFRAQEERIAKFYEDALRSRLPSSAHFLLQAQYSLLRKAHDHIKNLELRKGCDATIQAVR